MASIYRKRVQAQRTTGDVKPFDIAQLQSNISSVVDDLADRLYLQGTTLTDVTLETGYENLIEHGLGRAAEGFFVLDADDGVTIWRVSGSSADVTKFLPLGASCACDISLVVF